MEKSHVTVENLQLVNVVRAHKEVIVSVNNIYIIYIHDQHKQIICYLSRYLN